MKSLNKYRILLYVSWLCLYVNCEWIENKGLWYYISPSEEIVDYHKAISRCEAMNSRLAVITNDDQNNVIVANIKDDTQRWIGLSNNKTQDHYGVNCSGKDYFWNNDRYCLNDFDKFEENYDSLETSGCIGVMIQSDGRWTANICTKHFGFVCQWECKTFLLHFEYMEKFSGIYLLDYYWNYHIGYIKTNTDDTIEIYKRGGSWVLTILRSNYYPDIATFQSDSYVPYRESMYWNIYHINRHIKTGFFCVDCNHLSLYVTTNDNLNIYQNDMYLTLDYPNLEYLDDGHAVIITYDNELFKSCIEISIPDIDFNINCAYIFPYPDRTTTIETHSGDIVYIDNLCTTRNDVNIVTDSITVFKTYETPPSTIALEYYTFESTLEPKRFPEQTTNRTVSLPQQTSLLNKVTTDSGGLAAELDGAGVDNTVVIAVTVALLLVTIIIVTVVVSVLVKRRNRQKQQQADTFQTANTNNRDAQANTNVYLDFDGLVETTNSTNYQGFEANGVEHPYDDLLEGGPTPVVDGDHITGEKQEKNNRTALIEGYIAPDYSVISENTTSHTDNVNISGRSDVVNAVYCKATAPYVLQPAANMNISPKVEETSHKETPVSQNAKINIGYETEDDIQLHENDVYVETLGTNLSINPHENSVYYNNTDTNGSRVIDMQATNIHATAPNEDDCEYYNVVRSTIDNDEDDLELFENSVYEETQ